MTVNDTDKFLVNRSGSSYHLEAQNLMAELQDDDLMLVNRAGKSYKATGAEIKDSLGPEASIVKPTILAPKQNAGIDDDNGPDADELEFVGSIPAGTDINTWGDAHWEVSENNFGSTMVDTKAITVPTSIQSLLPADRTNIALEPETIYQARLKYTSTDPALESAYSDVVTFKTGAPDDEWHLADVNGIWVGITAGNGYYVAVTSSGSVDKRLMYSKNGKDWTYVAVPLLSWYDITYGNGKFVAISGESDENQIMWADENDLDTWTTVPAIENNDWYKIEFGQNKFVAMARSVPFGNQPTKSVMESSDGITWTSPSIFDAVNVGDLVYGNNQWLMLKGYDVYRSADAINWTRINYAFNLPTSLTYGNGQWIVVTAKNNADVYRSVDTQNWATANAPSDQNWQTVTWGKDKYVALSYGGTSPYWSMYSYDGITWTSSEAPADGWTSTVYGNGKFVSVSNKASLVMVSTTGIGIPADNLYYDTVKQRAVDSNELVRRFGIDPETTDLEPYGIAELTEQPDYPVAGYTPDGDKYRPIEDLSGVVAALEAEVTTLTDG